MLDFIANFSISQIIFFIISLALAIKGGWDLADFFKNKYKEKFNKDFSQKKKEESLEEHYKNCREQHEQSVQLYTSLEQKIDDLTENVNTKFKDLNKRVDQLTESDMHDIKQAIVKDYHFFSEKQHWIDDFSLDCLEHRFADYQEEGGNSYIEGLMKELRQLPKHPV